MLQKSLPARNIFNDIALSFGSASRVAVEEFGSISLFFLRGLSAVPASVKKYHLIFEQMMRIGVNSISIVFLAATFIGGVCVFQFKYLAGDFIPLTYLGFGITKAIFTDLGPVLMALVLTGRIGAKLAAELGTMKVTEQIDAMICLSLDPYAYLLTPRILAGFLMTPVLIIFTFFFATMSAQLISWLAFGLNPSTFFNSMRYMFKTGSLMIGIVKGFVFGGGIALAGCYYGYLAHGGAVGVGEATKKAVVAASILILFTNVVINLILM
jgi:phospholipid/cholesterol/gamma-HCH transport system permease protein